MIKTIGLEAIQRRLKKLQARTKDTQPLLNEISNLVINKTEDSFETHTDPWGNKWEKLKDKTKKYKKHKNKILFDSGNMQESLFSQVTNDDLIVGLNATANGFPYSAVHQYGSEKRNIPQRAFFPVDNDGKMLNDLVEDIDDILGEFFN